MSGPDVVVVAFSLGSENEWKRMQLRELAMINGTLRDDQDFFKCDPALLSPIPSFRALLQTRAVVSGRCGMSRGVEEEEEELLCGPLVQ